MMVKKHRIANMMIHVRHHRLLLALRSGPISQKDRDRRPCILSKDLKDCVFPRWYHGVDMVASELSVLEATLSMSEMPLSRYVLTSIFEGAIVGERGGGESRVRCE